MATARRASAPYPIESRRAALKALLENFPPSAFSALQRRSCRWVAAAVTPGRSRLGGPPSPVRNRRLLAQQGRQCPAEISCASRSSNDVRIQRGAVVRIGVGFLLGALLEEPWTLGFLHPVGAPRRSLSTRDLAALGLLDSISALTDLRRLLSFGGVPGRSWSDRSRVAGVSAMAATSNASDDDRAGILLSVEQVARELNVHRATVYDLLAKGQLASVKIGRRRLVARRTLEDFVDSLERFGV